MARKANRIPVPTIMVRTGNLANKAADAENFRLDSFDEMKLLEISSGRGAGSGGKWAVLILERSLASGWGVDWKEG